MAKSQNHTNHNQGFKLHRNGIKKPKRRLHMDTRGMDKKYLRNLRAVRRGNKRVARMTPEEHKAYTAKKHAPRISRHARKLARKEAKAKAAEAAAAAAKQ